MSETNPIDLPETLTEMVRSELRSDERAEWMAQPMRWGTTLQTIHVVFFGLAPGRIAFSGIGRVREVESLVRHLAGMLEER